MSAPVLPCPTMIGCYRAAPGRIVMPDVCCDIVFAAGQLTFVGPTTRAHPTRFAGHEVVLFSFDPIAARGLTAAPLLDFTDHVVQLADVAPHVVDQILIWIEAARAGLRSEPVGLAPSETDARLSIAARSLRDGCTVGATASRIGLGERQFERVFEKELGVRPKVFARILRLRQAVQQIKGGRTLAAAALDAGYCDQSHFNRDVRDLTGLPPSALLPNVGNVQDAICAE